MELKWKFSSIILLLVLLMHFINILCSGLALPDVTYKDIEDLNATCKGLDSCELPRRQNIIGHCSCHASCNLLGTCCVDSKYRNKYIEPLKNIKCQKYIYGKKVFSLPMIKKCDPKVLYDENTEKLCGSSGEDLNDPFLAIPVTDPVTGISYKNHYCYACNKNGGEDKPIPWNLKLTSNCIHQKLKNTSIPKLRSNGKAWFIILEQEIAIEVYFQTFIPEKFKSIIPHCYGRVSTDCAFYWTGDENIRRKCRSLYMALTRIISSDGRSFIKYQNPHCAICNYHRLNDMECLDTDEEYYDEEDYDDEENNNDIENSDNENNNDISDYGESDSNQIERNGKDESQNDDNENNDESNGNEDVSESYNDEDEGDQNDIERNDDKDNKGDEDSGDSFGDDYIGDGNGENDDSNGNGDGVDKSDEKNESNEGGSKEKNDDDDDKDSKGGIFFVKLFTLQDEIECKDNMVYDYFAKNCRKIPRAHWRNTFR